jgi:outer membrane protein OmpA-like peptidoglycan-associated protein
MDLFVSRLQADGTWGNPVNLGFPINTAADESSLLVAPDGRVAYFATDRVSPGNLDLWMLDLPEEVAAAPQRALTGRVFDASTGAALAAEVELRREDGAFHARLSSDPSDGTFALPLPEVGSLRFTVDLKGYAFYSATVAAEQFRESAVDIALERWKVGTTLTLRDVRFATNSAELAATQQAELDQLVALLAPGRERIRITGHTDATGSAAVNLDLSARRAAAVRDYLVARGIDGARLVTEGRGAAEPVATNDTPEGRALNRRTEVTVID